MITNFEDITSELNDDELRILPLIIKGFNQYKKSNPINADEIVNRMNMYLEINQIKMKMSQPKLRKYVNFIRTNGLLPLIATSNGYYVSESKEEIMNQIKSLYERSNSIKRCAEGLRKFI